MMEVFDKDFLLKCDCGCSIVRFSKSVYLDEDVYLMFYGLTGKRTGFWKDLLDSMKIIWRIISGKKHYFHDIVFSADQWKEFKNFINDIEE